MNLRNMTLYSVFIRNHGGTFNAVGKDIPRIRSLGADIIWLLPVHPIGKAKRKGTLGSPYAISDYRKVNPEYGTFDDFCRLADIVHANGMKLMIDVVYNHTSPDSWLAEHHPEWFYHKPDGSFGNRIGDWSDIIDLDYTHRELWEYQTETLKMWAGIVDGFRCDVAPLVPLDFWLYARKEVEKVCPGCIWLAESVEPEFTRENRNRGMISHSDAELYQAFDICYDYDIYGDFIRYVQGVSSLSDYTAALIRQDSIYPANYVKLRFLENHDRVRMAFLFPDKKVQKNWLAWMFFQKGMPLLYGGQEWAAVHKPDLFNQDPVLMDGEACYSGFIQRLSAIKKNDIFSEGFCSINALPNDILLAEWNSESQRMIGVFSLKASNAVIPVSLPDGEYRNYLDDRPVQIEGGMLSSYGEPIIIILQK